MNLFYFETEPSKDNRFKVFTIFVELEYFVRLDLTVFLVNINFHLALAYEISLSDPKGLAGHIVLLQYEMEYFVLAILVEVAG